MYILRENQFMGVPTLLLMLMLLLYCMYIVYPRLLYSYLLRVMSDVLCTTGIIIHTVSQMY